MKIVECYLCGKKIPMNETSSGFNMGNGPVYTCRSCRPPAKAEEIIKEFTGFIKTVSTGKSPNEKDV